MNVLFQWTEDMSVGEETIDKQHQKLLNQVNKILGAVMDKADKDEVQNALAFLNEYAKEHFTYEEKYMKENDYPELESHKKQHENFVRNYLKFKNDFDNGASSEKLILEIEKFLGEWWIEHIGHEDKKYSVYIGK